MPDGTRKTVFGTLVPRGNFEEVLSLPINKVMDKFIEDDTVLLCALERLGGTGTEDSVMFEVQKILIDLSLEKMIKDGVVIFDKSSSCLSLPKTWETKEEKE